MLNSRKGELQGMAPTGNGTTRLEFLVPSRGLIGFRGDFMTATKGNGVINTIFDEYLPYKGDMNYRSQGSRSHTRPVLLSLMVCSMHRKEVHCSSDQVNLYMPEWLSVKMDVPMISK